ENGIDAESGNVIVCIDPRYFRPTEVDTLLGDSSKARKQLGWEPKTTFKELVKEMVTMDLMEAEKDQLCLQEGFQTYNQAE
ncbi:MAG: GDP-mannose 4,6-dehydratase, partial [Desulfobacterales bacterium]|nr:GDP-mannose 4,6-dehydratase [Desulfobacterales bacterium]